LKINIITEYSLWFVPLCLLLGVGYALLLYYREKHHEFKKRTIRVMFGMRTISVALIAFLLLSPLVKTTSRTIEKPIIVVAQDNSQSIVFSKDSASIRKDYTAEMKKLTEELKGDYDLKTFSFGDKVVEGMPFSFSDKQTDVSAMLDEIQARYTNRNIGAVVIASDGLYNQGSNPVYASEQQKYPIYTIALGDTNVQKDLIVSRVNYNRICYLGNQFPLEIVVVANKCAGQKTTLTVKKGNETVFTKAIDLNTERYLETIQVQLDAKQPGIQHYRISLSQLDNEISYVNNYQDVFIEVLDGRQKILILAGAPHPDVSALKQSIENNMIYQVDDFLVDEFNDALDKYNLVILHQIPTKGKNQTSLLLNLYRLRIPVLYIVGASTDINALNAQKTSLVIRQSGDKTDEASPIVANDFTLFTVSEEFKNLAKDLPALMVPFGDYSSGNSLNTLLYQKIGSVPTNKPLLVFNTAADPKTGLLAGEGIWRWRLTNYLHSGNHNAFNEMVDKVIQYLSVKEEKGRFRVNNKSSFRENENIEFDAEVYNDSYELINEPEVKLTITNDQNKSFPFTFSRTEHAYHITAGIFPVGDYRFRAETKVGATPFSKSGAFTVSPVKVESISLVADHQLLYALASQHGGKMLYPGQLAQLKELLKQREDVKPVIYSKKSYNDLVNLFWVFLLITALLSAEWFIRKLYGAY
jgi:hypothetical protein